MQSLNVRACSSLHLPGHVCTATLTMLCPALCVLLQVSQEEWDAVVSAQAEVNPFLKWSFLNALEVSGSAVCTPCAMRHSRAFIGSEQSDAAQRAL